MTPGQIVVDRVSQRFRVSERPYRTLKDIVVAAAARRDQRGLGAARRLARGRAGRGARPRRPQRLGQDDAAAARLRASSSRPRARIAVGGRIGSLLELGAGFHPDFTGRENVYLNGSIHGLSTRPHPRGDGRDRRLRRARARSIDLPVRTYSSGMYMRLGFSVAAHIQADVLLLDEVFAVGDEEFQRKCFGKIHEFKSRGGTIVFVSHDAQAVERLCDRAVLLRQGEVVFNGADARGDRRVPAAARRRAQPRRARRRPARVGKRRGADRLGAAARRRGRRARRSSPPGSAAIVELVVASRRRRRAADRLARAARRRRARPRRGDPGDRGARLGRRARASATLRFEIERLPLADGPLPPPLRADRGARRPAPALARRRRSASSSSRPGAETGAVLLEGRWSMQENRALRANRRAMSSRTCPDWPQLMELAPELQFKHYTLREAQLPADALVTLERVDFDAVAICCDLDRHVFYAEHTDPAVAERAARLALVRPARVGRALAGRRRRLSRRAAIARAGLAGLAAGR